MDFSSILTFWTVAETGNVSRAAEQLNTVQSNVTGRIRRLEEDLDVKLFVRHSRGVTLTPPGEILLGYAGRVLQLVEDARRAVGDAAGEAGTVRIGAMETTAAVRLTESIAKFHVLFPRATLSLATGPADQMVRDTLEWRLDGAFVAGPVRHPDLVSTPVFSEELVLVSTANVPDDKHLPDQTLLVFPLGCAYRARAEAWLRRSGAVPIRLTEVGTLDGLLGCVAAGVGVTLIPRSVVERPQYKGRFICRTIPSPDFAITTVFIRRKDQPCSDLLAKLLAIITGDFAACL